MTIATFDYNYILQVSKNETENQDENKVGENISDQT